MNKHSTTEILVIVLIMFILTPADICQGQSFKAPMKMPHKYMRPTVETMANTGASNIDSPIDWKVWADRSNIVTSNGKRPAFLEEFFVVEESEDALRVVKDNGSYNPTEEAFLPNPRPIDYGWIPKKYLLLWPSALYDSKTNFREKILTISDVEHMDINKEKILKGEKLMEYYSSPTSKSPLNLETPIFEVFYVYKKLGDRMLIGKVEDLTYHKAQKWIHGWVNESIVQSWGHRQTLEPNNNAAIAQKRKSNNIEASLFSNVERTEQYINNPQKNELAYWSSDNYDKGYDNQWYRMPILKQNGNIVETAVISDLFTTKKVGGKVMLDSLTDKETSIYKTRFEEQQLKTSQINLVFVLDATQSMGAPLNSVKEAVLSTASQLENSLNKFQFGAVVYRDYKDANDKSCFEVHKLGTYQSFYSFLSTVDTEDPACYNNTISEGMYKGLLMATPMFRDNEKETNVIVLVGDAGDRKEKWRVGEQEVVNMLVKNSISLITIQAHKYKDKAYTDFITQTKSLSQKSANQLAENQKKLYGENNLTIKTTTPKFRRDSKDNRTLFNLEDSPVGGAIQYASSGTEIHPSIIEKEVSRIITEIDSTNADLLATLSSILNSSQDSMVFDPEVMQVLIKAGFGSDYIDFLSKKRYQFMMGGYTAIKVNGLQDDVYKYVLFLDEQELKSMITSLDKLVVPGKNFEQRRTGLYNAFLKLLTTNYGVPVSEVDGMSVGEIMGLVTGLPSKSPLLQKKVGELLDPMLTTNTEITNMINEIKSSRDRLTRVPQNSRYSFVSDLKRYYWLPQEILP